MINSSNQGSKTLRNSPDVAAEANFDNPTVINGSLVTGYGGTSFAAPRWAGFSPWSISSPWRTARAQ